MNEVWKPVAGYEGHYDVSSLGRVKSVARTRRSSRGNGTQFIRERILKQASLPAGYQYVMLSKGNKATHRLVHRLVAVAFVENPNCLDVVNHIDGVKSNNSYENLQWVTSSQNNIHAIYSGLRTPARGEQFRSAKLTDDMVAVMRRLALKLSIKDIAEALQVSENCASGVLRYKSWKHTV